MLLEYQNVQCCHYESNLHREELGVRTLHQEELGVHFFN